MRRSKEDVLQVKVLCSKGLKKCNRCMKLKPLSKYGSHKGGICGLNGICTPCRYEKQKRQVSTNLKHVEGLDESLLLQRYKGCCEICGVKAFANNRRALHIDHDHHTNKVRGLLCHHCNLMLGHAKDNPLVLELAIKYLEKYRND